MSGRHRKPTTSSVNVAKLAFTGAVIGGGGLTLSGHAKAATDSEWDQVARCESGGNWAINTGNGYHGGLQFTGQPMLATASAGTSASAISPVQSPPLAPAWRSSSPASSR